MRKSVMTILTQFIKFGIVGVANTILGYFIYVLCIWGGMHYLLANIIGFFVSTINAFYWGNCFVFKKGEDEYRNICKSLIKTFLAYASTGVILNSVLLWLYIDVFNISEFVAPLLILFFTVPSNFLLNKYWSFKTNKK